MTALNRPMFMAKGGQPKKFPDLSGDGKVTRKDILIGRGVINKANGGGVVDMMGMMAPEPAMMAQQDIPPQIQDIANQGAQVGADLVVGQEAAIDAAQDPEQLINAIRGNALPLQARYDELATFVGQNDAAITPTSVLALTQPGIVMAQEGEMDQGVGGLMQEMTDDVMMDDAMGMPTPMGMGVGELLAGPPPVQMALGGSAADAAADEQFLQSLLGMTDQERGLQQFNMGAAVLNAAANLLANKDASGNPLTGNTLAKVANVAGPAVQQIGQIAAGPAAINRQIKGLLAQDALSRRARSEQDAAGLARVEAQIAAQLANQPLTEARARQLLTPDLVAAYGAGLTTPEQDALVEMLIGAVTQYRETTAFTESTDDSPARMSQELTPVPLPGYLAEAIKARQGIQTDGDAQPQPVPEPEAGVLDVARVQDEASAVLGQSNVDALFGPGGFIYGSGVDPVLNVFGIETQGQAERDAARAFLVGLQERLVTAKLSDPGIRDSKTARDAFEKRFPSPGDLQQNPRDAQFEYQDLRRELATDLENVTRRINQRQYEGNREAGQLQTSKTQLEQSISELTGLINALIVANARMGELSAGQINVDADFLSDLNATSGTQEP